MGGGSVGLSFSLALLLLLGSKLRPEQLAGLGSLVSGLPTCGCVFLHWQCSQLRSSITHTASSRMRAMRAFHGLRECTLEVLFMTQQGNICLTLGPKWYTAFFSSQDHMKYPHSESRSSTNSRQTSFLVVHLRVLMLEHAQKPHVDTQWRGECCYDHGQSAKDFGGSRELPGYDLWLCC